MNISEVTCECHVPPKSRVATSKVTQKRKPKRRDETHEQASTSVSIVPKANIVEWKRANIFNEQWTKIEAKLMRFSAGLFAAHVKELYQFIVRYTIDSITRKIELKGCDFIGFNCGLLPTAMIALSSKMTQNRFATEVAMQLDKSGHAVKTLPLNVFSFSSMSNLFQTFFNELLKDQICTDDDGDFKRHSWKTMSFDDIFRHWLKSIGIDSNRFNDGMNSHSTSTAVASLVIFVYDFENVNKQNLINLITILKEYVTQIPIVLVFFIYNQLNSSIQYYLPASAIDNLIIEDIRPFYEPKFIPQLLREFIAEKTIRFKIHPRLVEEIHSYFSNYEFSFANFLNFIKSLAFDYFYHNPLSTICLPTEMFRQTLLNDRELLSVFQNTVIVDDETNYVDSLIDKYEDLLINHIEFTFNLQMVYDLLQSCYYIDSKDFFKLYHQMSSSNFNYREEFLSGLFRVRENVFMSSLKKIIAQYRPKAISTKYGLLRTFEHYEEQLEKLMRQEAEEEQSQLDSTRKLGLECEVKIVKNKLRNLHSRSEWRKSMTPKSAENRAQLSRFDKWKTDFVDEIHEELRRLSPHNSSDLMGTFFYNNIDFIRKHHFVSIRDDIHQSLDRTLSPSSSNKHAQLSFKNTYPNSYILYQLFKEASPVVNLYEWFEKFCEEKRLAAKDVSMNELIVHFSTTLSDFDFIGMLQSSRYKADYINKLVWL